ncbi:translation initiation factor IF-2 [Ostreibacterium oceani]|uniref:Translation initiation factor IF-2 n=1 Tax=Ostreibacterium oceani TaxID=2654998 RepID=A0A6N7EXR1_9GAMM|nr:translation initiation factor IF-2 [Ostreibacterium oceani]MPV85917.1 translation initiation factor IF-2 [Ostreibacterium oceani]
MSEVTVKALATQVGIEVDKLLVQFKEAGIPVTDASQMVSDDEKKQLLAYLRQLHGKSDKPRPKIALKKRSTIAVTGKKDGVSVEVRSKKVVVKPGAEGTDETSKKTTERKPSAAEIAKKLAEAKRLQQADAMRESQEAQRQKELEETKKRTEKEQEARREKAESAKRKQVADKEKTEGAAKRKAAESEAKAKAEAERLKNLEAEAKANAEAELAKQALREKASSKTREQDELARKQADEEYQRQLKNEQMGEGKFRINQKEKRKITRKSSKPVELQNKHKFERPQKEVAVEVALPETLTVGELAQKMNRKASELIMVMMKMGSMVTINQVLDRDTATLLLEEMGIAYQYINENQAEEALMEAAQSQMEDVRARAPIVTIMGHVDHGKTSLLDYIRKTRVTAGEAGGITQHIGSYHVETENGIVTFLDTPGHAAFTAMRARGAKVTDVVVIVVAADDGVMPQTIEAIQHAKAAKSPIIIAINKIDKPDADPEKIKGELTQHEIVPEDWGGDVMVTSVSAHTGEGVDDLLEKILLQAEVLELKAPHKGPAQGIVIESRIDKGRGVVASVLVQKGELHKGDFVLSGLEYGRIRAMADEDGKPIINAGPSIPVEILGLSGAPQAGDEMMVVSDEKTAKELANKRQIKIKEAKLARQQKAKLENLFANVGENAIESVNVMIKTDVHGSSEALRDSLLKLSTDAISVTVVGASVGGITESDVNLAIASQAIIIGFNVRAEAGAKKLAEVEGVDLRYYSVIYDAIEDVKQAMLGKMSTEFSEEIVGIAEVREVFKAPKIGQIAGCIVIDGYVKRNNPIRVLRDNVVIYEGELESLRRFKDDVAEVKSGTECGIGVKNYNDVKIGDQIECFERKAMEKTL